MHEVEPRCMVWSSLGMFPPLHFSHLVEFCWLTPRNWPVGQMGHDSATPVVLLNRPTGQTRHDAAPSSDGWWKPRGHRVHRAAFWISENCPATQSTQVSSAPFRRFPALHAEQDALPLPAVRPVLQCVQVLASGASVYVFLPHRGHARWPVRLLARPGMQGRHDAELFFGW